MNKHTSRVVLFIGDTHFHLIPRSGEQERLERFLSFLEMARQADDLVLLGDIFDFWIDYPHLRLRGYEEILQSLDAVRDAGTKLHFIGGNHDIWAAQFLTSPRRDEGRLGHASDRARPPRLPHQRRGAVHGGAGQLVRRGKLWDMERGPIRVERLRERPPSDLRHQDSAPKSNRTMKRCWESRPSVLDSS
jgi:DNA repair exonuclease SbcCD nuclease subunit